MTSLPNESTLNNTWYKALGREFSRALVNYAELGSYIEPFVQAYRPFWSPEGHRARILEVRHENHKVFSIIMRPSRHWPGFKAGQFIELFTEHNGRRIGRCFSISSSPALYEKQGIIRLTIRVQENGRITPVLRRTLVPGQFVGLSEAQGEFTLRDTSTALLLIAGGSGITPFQSMLEELSYRARNQDIKLVYYARNQNEHLFRKEFDMLTRNHPNVEVVYIATKTSGRLSEAQLEQYCPDYLKRQIYLCGPTGMIQSARKILLSNSVPEKNIFLEYFGSTPIEALDTDTGGHVYFANSKESASSTPEQPQSLLSLAEQSGLKPKSGCRMGLCGQCVCTKQSGVVYNTKTGRQSDARAEDIKLCISVPVGDVTLDL